MGGEPTQSESPRLAAIDVGTNSIRLVVAEVNGDGSYRVLDEERGMVRLGRGLDQTGRLSDRSMTDALQVLGRMKAIADGFRVGELRAIATSAVREAANGAVFCREALRRHRVQIDVIAPQEEARLAFASAARHFNLEPRTAAVIDIGGGSAEVILAAGGVIEQIHSLPLGAVRLTERHCLSDPLKPRHWRALRDEIEGVVRDAIGKPPFRPDVMIGSGGTFTNLAEMVQQQREGRSSSPHGAMITAGEVDHLLDRLRETPLELRRRMPGLNPGRADIIVAGAAVVGHLAGRLGSHQILINERGIRDGLLQSMVAELHGPVRPAPAPPKDRMEWVRLFARKCRSNERHCEHVARLATDIFDGLQRVFELPDSGREILIAAALLHDIGYLISHSQHHKHAYHLIVHGDLPGFSAVEVDLIANVARYHRRAFPKRKHANLARLDRAQQHLVAQLAGILRIADGLDRAHAQAVESVQCSRRVGRVRFSLTASQDPQVEIWDAQRKSDLFAEVFLAKPQFVWSGAISQRAARMGRRAPRILAASVGG